MSSSSNVIFCGRVTIPPQAIELTRHFANDRAITDAERAALLVLGDRLNHRPEDVRVDLRPIKAADV